jgi:hypothetical protein
MGQQEVVQERIMTDIIKAYEDDWLARRIATIRRSPITVVQDFHTGKWWVIGQMTGEVGAPFVDKETAIYGAHTMIDMGVRYMHDPLPDHMKGFI